MYKALESFTTKNYDVRRGQILAEDFTTQDEITEFLNIGYIVEYDGSLEITENGTYDVKDYEQAIVDVSGGGGLDWSAIGYDSTPQAIIDGYNYALEIQNNFAPATSMWSKYANDRKLTFFPLVDTSISTSMPYMFSNCQGLISISLIDTKNVKNFERMFSGCQSLKDVPQFDTSNATSFLNTFGTCYCLSDNSLNNILEMCINASSYTGAKTLATLGLTKSYYPVSRIEALSSYQAFLNAGWTIGY